MVKIYTAGTIYGYDEEGYEWKDKLACQLDIYTSRTDFKFELLDPKPENECHPIMVSRDKAMISSCDVFVAYIAKYSVGTSMEIFYAHMLETIPIIIIDPKDMLKNNIWITEHSHMIVNSISDAALAITRLNFE